MPVIENSFRRQVDTGEIGKVSSGLKDLVKLINEKKKARDGFRSILIEPDFHIKNIEGHLEKLNSFYDRYSEIRQDGEIEFFKAIKKDIDLFIVNISEGKDRVEKPTLEAFKTSVQSINTNIDSVIDKSVKIMLG